MFALIGGGSDDMGPSEYGELIDLCEAADEVRSSLISRPETSEYGTDLS